MISIHGTKKKKEKKKSLVQFISNKHRISQVLTSMQVEPAMVAPRIQGEEFDNEWY